MLGTESLGVPFCLRVTQLTSPTLPWAKPRPNHVFQTPPVFLPTVSALMVQVSRPHLNQRTATRDANFDRRRRSAGCAAPGVCCSAARGMGSRGVTDQPTELCAVIRAGQPTPKQVSSGKTSCATAPPGRRSGAAAHMWECWCVRTRRRSPCRSCWFDWPRPSAARRPAFDGRSLSGGADRHARQMALGPQLAAVLSDPAPR